MILLKKKKKVLSLRAYPISGNPAVDNEDPTPDDPASGFQGRYWYYNDFDRRGYPAAQLSDHATTGYRALSSMTPIQLDFNAKAIGLGQHFSFWTTILGWDEDNVVSEVDLLEIVGTSGGILFSMGTHEPSPNGVWNFTDGTGYSTDPPQSERVNRWYRLKLDFDGNDLVWYLNGVEKLRQENSKSRWDSGDDQCFVMSWEVGGSWPGLPADDDPKGQPSDPTTDTPWPCEVLIRNLSFAGVLVDLSKPTYNRNEYYQEYLDNSSTQPTLDGWVTAYPYGSNLTSGIVGDLRLYGNTEHGISCNDTWTGDGNSPEGTGDPVITALTTDGWSDPFIIRHTRR